MVSHLQHMILEVTHKVCLQYMAGDTMCTLACYDRILAVVGLFAESQRCVMSGRGVLGVG